MLILLVISAVSVDGMTVMASLYIPGLVVRSCRVRVRR